MDYKFYVLSFLFVLCLFACIFIVFTINKIVLCKYDALPKLQALEKEYKTLSYRYSQSEHMYNTLKDKYEVQERLLSRLREESRNG